LLISSLSVLTTAGHEQLKTIKMLDNTAAILKYRNDAPNYNNKHDLSEAGTTADRVEGKVNGQTANIAYHNSR
jgi:hypothetical protein